MSSWLHPYDHEPKERRIGSIDIETDGLGGPYLLGASFIEGGDLVLHPFADDIWARVVDESNADVVWYAHNGGRYDLRYLMDCPAYHRLIEEGWSGSIVCSGEAQVLGLKMSRSEPRRSVQIRDSYRLTGKSLDASCQALGVEGKVNGAIDFEGGERFDPANPLHRLYLAEDCRAVVRMVRAYSDLIRQHFGCAVGWTAPATAMRAFQRTLTRSYHRLSPGAERMCREGYYGGLVRPGYLSVSKAKIWDRNSAYPAQMMESLPCGRGIHTTRERPGRMAIYRVRADVPEDAEWTVIPVRRRGATLFPRGRFETVCTSMEIDLARELGHQVEVIEGFYWTYSETLCRPFVQKCEHLRQTDYFGPIGEIAKLMQNSLYGKFGSKPHHTAYRVGDGPHPGETLISDPMSEWVVWGHEEESQMGYIHPEWAAWITAGQRCQIHRLAMMLGPDHVVYADTDSMVLTGAEMPEERQGPAYGNWKLEAEVDEMVVLAPKTYAVRDKIGKTWAKCKGIPRRSLSYQDVVDAMTRPVAIGFLSQTGLLPMLKHGLPKAVSVTRTVSSTESSHGWVLEAWSGRYRPIWQDDAADLSAALHGKDRMVRPAINDW